MANNFLPFCPTDTGTNLLDQADYAIDTDRTSGNKPGVASSRLNNKALRQATYVVSQVAQYLADTTATDLLDDAVPARLLAQIRCASQFLPPKISVYTSGSGTHNLTYYFYIATGSATIGATYTNNAVTFTVVATVASATVVRMTGSGAPATSGTLTKASGTGDSTLTFYSVRAPQSMMVKMVGGGGGGGGGGAGGATGGTGGTTTFGTSPQLSCTGGAGGNVSGVGGAGGTATAGFGAGTVLDGSRGMSTPANVAGSGGGCGGVSPFGGAGSNGVIGIGAATAAIANTGSGGGGAGTNSASGSGGGGAGGYIAVLVTSPASTYAYSVGAAGVAGAGANAPGAGGSGVVQVVEYYQ